MRTIKLNQKYSVALAPIPPFNFDATFHKPSHFPSSDCHWEKDKYLITMLWRGKYLGLKFGNKGTVSRPKVKLTICSQKLLDKKFIKNLIPEIEWRFNLQDDICEFCKRFRNDKILGPVLKKWKGTRPVAANSFYETLIIYFVLQNAVVRRSVQMLKNIFNRFGKKVKFDNKTLSSFWPPKTISKISERTLRDLKLGYRAKFIKRVSEQFVKGEIDEFKMRQMPTEELRKECLKIYGVGPASLQYILFEDFYRYDFIETIAPWEQKILSKLLYNKKLVSIEKIIKDADKRWGKWKNLALHYIWEDIFWQRRHKKIDWLEKEIRL